jgi:hypothetical protein
MIRRLVSVAGRRAACFMFGHRVYLHVGSYWHRVIGMPMTWCDFFAKSDLWRECHRCGKVLGRVDRGFEKVVIAYYGSSRIIHAGRAVATCKK